MNATISDEIPVRYYLRQDVGLEFLEFDIPNGWNDVKKVSKKVLVYDGKKFTFSCWNSDKMVCYFSKPINGEVQTAKICKR